MIHLGKYQISPMTRPLALGRHSASVSIRSGQGMASHDRVLRLISDFDSAQGALDHALAEGCDWVNRQGAPAC